MVAAVVVAVAVTMVAAVVTMVVTMVAAVAAVVTTDDGTFSLSRSPPRSFSSLPPPRCSFSLRRSSLLRSLYTGNTVRKCQYKKSDFSTQYQYKKNEFSTKYQYK
jgi:hypothetical protein